MAYPPHIDFTRYQVLPSKLTYRPDWYRIFVYIGVLLFCAGFWLGFIGLLWHIAS